MSGHLLKPTNGQSPAPPVASIRIDMLQSGQIMCHYQGPGRDVFNMMIARAQQDMVPQLMAAEQQKVVAPQPIVDPSRIRAKES
jgi:hypothetical protein